MLAWMSDGPCHLTRGADPPIRPHIGRSSALSVGGFGRVDAGCSLSASRFSRCVKARNLEEQNRVQNNRVWQRGCGLMRTVVEGVRFDDTADAIIVSVRPNARARGRCGRCGRRAPGYDHGNGRRRWRGLDAGTTRVFLEADAQRRSMSSASIAQATTWNGSAHRMALGARRATVLAIQSAISAKSSYVIAHALATRFHGIIAVAPRK